MIDRPKQRWLWCWKIKRRSESILKPHIDTTSAHKCQTRAINKIKKRNRPARSNRRSIERGRERGFRRRGLLCTVLDWESTTRQSQDSTNSNKRQIASCRGEGSKHRAPQVHEGLLDQSLHSSRSIRSYWHIGLLSETRSPVLDNYGTGTESGRDWSLTVVI